jgi:hypothetical protein
MLSNEEKLIKRKNIELTILIKDKLNGKTARELYQSGLLNKLSEININQLDLEKYLTIKGNFTYQATDDKANKIPIDFTEYVIPSQSITDEDYKKLYDIFIAL